MRRVTVIMLCGTAMSGSAAAAQDVVEALVKPDGSVLACGKTFSAEEGKELVAAIQWCTPARSRIPADALTSGDLRVELERNARPGYGSGGHPPPPPPPPPGSSVKPIAGLGRLQSLLEANEILVRDSGD